MLTIARRKVFGPLSRAVAALVCGLVVSSMAVATPVEFANFHLLNANQPFNYVNLGGAAGQFGATNVPVVFNFTTQSGLPTADHAATLTITQTIAPIPVTVAGGVIIQQLPNVATLAIVDNATGHNLLTMGFTGLLTGAAAGPNANISGNDAMGLVAFSSFYGTFPSPGNSFNLGLGTISPVLTIGAGGFPASFVSNIGGQFTANFSANIPEPSSMILAGMALLGVVAYKRRRGQGV